MIQRLIPKNTVRFLGIKYDGTNHQEILEFCKYAHYRPLDKALFLCVYGESVNIAIGKWVVNTIDDRYIIMNDKEISAIFKPNGSR